MTGFLRIGIAGNKDALGRVEPWLTTALNQYLPPRGFAISHHDPYPPGQNNTELVTLVRQIKGLGPMQTLHHRAGTIARVMLERNPEIDVMLRIDSGPLQIELPRPTNVHYDTQFGVVAMLATRLKGAGAVMLYAGMTSQGFLSGSGVGHRQETNMSEAAVQGVLPRWWMEYTRGAHMSRASLAA